MKTERGPGCITIDILRVEHQALPNELASFLQDHPRATWFTKNMLIPVPLVGGNFLFVIIMARSAGKIVGALVTTAYYRFHEGSVKSGCFRVQVNGLPMIVAGDPGEVEVFKQLLAGLDEFTSADRAETEFRNCDFTPWERQTLLNAGYRFHPHLNLIKPLTHSEAGWHSLDKNRRRQITRALRNGTRTEPATTEAQVRDYYAILEDLYLHKIQKKLPPLNLFLDFFHRCRQSGDGMILLVMAGDRVIGGIVCLIEPGKRMYEWYVCGLDRTYREHSPSVMATWGAIRWACEHDIPVFDFLGLGQPSVPYGVRDFKLRFGGTVSNFGRFTRF